MSPMPDIMCDKEEVAALAKLKPFMVLCGLVVLVFVSWVVAGAEPIAPALELQGVDDETCLACHGIADLRITLPSEEILYLTVDAEAFAGSVHGQQGVGCVQCHPSLTGFPHEPLTATSRRDFVLERYRASCLECHADQYEQAMDDVHQRALAAGDTNAAVCTDCHGAHEVRPVEENHFSIVQTCGKCHSQVYELYEASVHGEALTEEGNPDVPTCTDCHEVHAGGQQHGIEGPRNSDFHLFSPQVCAECHADEDMMGRYGISTKVFDTYVDDFHGTTVQLFQDVGGGEPTDKPVCVDCHGVHDMKQVDDPQSKVIRENLLVTCQRCHPDATANFPASWTSHWVPSPDHSPMVYFVNGFYNWFFIPVLIGGMLAYVSLDGLKRIRNRRKERRHNV